MHPKGSRGWQRKELCRLRNEDWVWTRRNGTSAGSWTFVRSVSSLHSTWFRFLALPMLCQRFPFVTAKTWQIHLAQFCQLFSIRVCSQLPVSSLVYQIFLCFPGLSAAAASRWHREDKFDTEISSNIARFPLLESASYCRVRVSIHAHDTVQE